MAIPDGFLDELKARVDLASVIARRVRLSRRGREYVGLCPFHNEKTPSFTVNEAKGFYHCFGCQAHGSAIDFVMQADGLGFREAVEQLAAGVGLEIPPDSPADRERAQRRRTLFEVNEAAAAFFERALRMPGGRVALAYLRRRGLDDETIARFRLGFAPEGGAPLTAALTGAGFGEDLMREAGLLTAPDDGARRAHERFRGRVMFPIADRRGRVIAFGGRVLGAGEPKYLNSPETPTFHKGRTLYGAHLAAAAAQQVGQVVVVEGYLDVIAFHAAGYAHTVAPLGTALTEEQLTELWRLAPEPVLLFDPDAAGRRAAARALERALPLVSSARGVRFAFVETATGDDPDGVVRRYPRQFVDSALQGALSLSEMLFWMESRDRRHETPEERAALEARLRRQAARINDLDLRRAVQDSFRARLRPPPRRSGAAPAPGIERRTVPGVRPPRTGPLDAARVREAILIAVPITHPAAVERIGERLGALSFSSLELDSLRQQVLFRLTSFPDLDAEGLQSHLRGCGFSEVLDSVLDVRTRAGASFARPGVALDAVVEGWENTYAEHCRFGLRREMDERKRELRNGLVADVSTRPSAAADGRSGAAFTRFKALKHQEKEGSG